MGGVNLKRNTAEQEIGGQGGVNLKRNTAEQ
jgi:hypothetical protein